MSVCCLKFNIHYHSGSFCTVCTNWGSPVLTEVVPDKVPQHDDGDKSPQTGDNRNNWIWFALAFISGCCIFGTTSYLKKEKVSDE